MSDLGTNGHSAAELEDEDHPNPFNSENPTDVADPADTAAIPEVPPVAPAAGSDPVALFAASSAAITPAHL